MAGPFARAHNAETVRVCEGFGRGAHAVIAHVDGQHRAGRVVDGDLQSHTLGLRVARDVAEHLLEDAEHRYRQPAFGQWHGGGGVHGQRGFKLAAFDEFLGLPLQRRPQPRVVLRMRCACIL